LLRKDFCPCGGYCRFDSNRFPFSDDLDTMTKPILEIENLNAFFPGKQVLHDVSLTVQTGRKLALVGESGSGKTVLAQGIMRLNPLVSFKGRLKFDGNDLLTQSERALQKLRGREIGMVFQEPMTALNPVMRVGAQIAEVLTLHLGLDKKQAWARAVELLAETGIREPEQKAFAYPFQLSGGQRQRAMIAMAVAAARMSIPSRLDRRSTTCPAPLPNSPAFSTFSTTACVVTESMPMRSSTDRSIDGVV